MNPYIAVEPLLIAPAPELAQVPKSMTKWHSAVFYALLAVAWLGCGMLALYLNRTELFIGLDGSYMRDLARRQFEWGLSPFSAAMDWFYGVGDVYFDVNFRLLPSFIAAAIFGDTNVAKVLTYEIILGELSFAVVLFGLSLGASRAVAIVAALVTCVGLLPFYHPTLIYGLLPLIPHIGSSMAAALLAGAAFLQFGRRSWLTDLPYAFIVFALLAWSVLFSITIVMLAAPFLLLCAVSGIIASANRSERRCKIGLFTAAVLLMATGPALYFLGTVLDTAAIVFPGELANNRASFYLASILFHWNTVSPFGPLLVIFAIAGAVYELFDWRNRTLRIFAITLLTYLATRLTFAVLVIAYDFWRGPAAVYFEYYVIPLYALFAGQFFARIAGSIWKAVGWSDLPARLAEIGVVGAAVAATLAIAASNRPANWGFQYPPHTTAITNILARESALRPGSLFRGRTANMTGRSIERSIDWLDLHSADYYLALQTGNEMRVLGLTYFGIPTLTEYTATISPFFYGLTSRLLETAGDKQMRSSMVLREFEPRVLAMLGVRFVITDREYDGAATLREKLALKDRTLLLYEIANPNLGNYSPTKVSRIALAPEIIARLADPKFDPAREIIADVPGDTNDLVPARDAHLIFLGGSLRLQSESDGRSILLVPLEFSECLDAHSLVSANPLLFRANLLETGILFSGRLDVVFSLRTGPFLNPACRLRDFFAARRLRVGAVPALATH